MTMSLLERGRHGIPLTDVEIIDMHAHIGRAPFPIPATSARSIIDVMDRTGVSKTVVAPMLPASQAETDMANRAVLEAVEAFPGRILGYMRPWPASTPVSAREAEQALDPRFTGMKLHNVIGIDYTHASYAPYLAVANERRMPVLFHSWGARAEFEQFRAIAKQYPQLNLLLAHTGSNNEGEYVAIAREHPNVFLELALSRGPRGLIERLVEHVGADRIVWGSDICFINQAHQLGKVLGADLSDEQKRQILSGNARRMLRIRAGGLSEKQGSQ